MSLFLSIHPSHGQDEKPGLLHTSKSGFKYWLLQRTGGFWKTSALNSFTSPPAAAAGSDHALVSHNRVMWQHDLSQGLQACAGSAQHAILLLCLCSKKVRDMAGKIMIPSNFFFLLSLESFVLRIFVSVLFFFLSFPPQPPCCLGKYSWVGRLCI